MLDIRFIRSNPDAVKDAVRNKGFDVDIDELLKLDEQRRALITDLDTARERKNALPNEIKNATKETRPPLIEEARELRDKVTSMEGSLRELTETYEDLLLRVPNVPRPEVPIGQSDADNVELRREGTIPTYDFKPRDHVELMSMHKLANFDDPPKFAGARAYALTGRGALLELAIVRMAADILTEAGFEVVLPPVMVREQAMMGTGFLPHGEREAYHLPADKLYLVGTSEVALVSMHMGDILDGERLPIKYAGISSCFRREAGSYGRDTRGVYRVHQFTKVEQVVFCEPDQEVSDRWHKAILGNAEEICRRLELPYRVALACTRELGMGEVLKHEIECWMPSREAWSETHSCSSLGDFQSRRSNIRVRLGDGKPVFPYTLNNTAVASPRILIPLLEIHQQADGSIKLPKALVPYMGGLEVIAS